MRGFYEVYSRILRTLGLDKYLEKLSKNEDHRGTAESFGKLIEESGFHLSKTVLNQFQFRFWDGSALLKHFLTRIGFLEGWRTVVDPADEMLVFKTLEESLNSLAQEQGSFTLTIPMLYLEARKKR